MPVRARPAAAPPSTEKVAKAKAAEALHPRPRRVLELGRDRSTAVPVAANVGDAIGERNDTHYGS